MGLGHPVVMIRISLWIRPVVMTCSNDMHITMDKTYHCGQVMIRILLWTRSSNAAAATPVAHAYQYEWYREPPNSSWSDWSLSGCMYIYIWVPMEGFFIFWHNPCPDHSTLLGTHSKWLPYQPTKLEIGQNWRFWCKTSHIGELWVHDILQHFASAGEIPKQGTWVYEDLALLTFTYCTNLPQSLLPMFLFGAVE